MRHKYYTCYIILYYVETCVYLLLLVSLDFGKLFISLKYMFIYVIRFVCAYYIITIFFSFSAKVNFSIVLLFTGLLLKS